MISGTNLAFFGSAVLNQTVGVQDGIYLDLDGTIQKVFNLNDRLDGQRPLLISLGNGLSGASLVFQARFAPGITTPALYLARPTFERTQETFTYSVDWGDGTASDTGVASIDVAGTAETATGASFDGSHVYADNGTYVVTVTVTDDDGGSNSQTFEVTVNNANPTLTVVGNQTTNEGQALSITDIGTLTDPGFDNPLNPNGASVETFNFSVDWGDGSTQDGGAVTVDTSGDRNVLTQASFDSSHRYAVNGTFTVTVTVTDDDGGNDSDSFQVIVASGLCEGVQFSHGVLTACDGDDIEFFQFGGVGDIFARVDGITWGPFGLAEVTKFVAFGNDGNDGIVVVPGTLEIPAEFYGGPGNDIIFGASKNDLLDGGKGDDIVYGLQGDDTGER